MSSASTVSSTYRSAGGLSLHTRVGLVLCLLTASLLGVLGGLWLQGTRSAIHEEVEAATRVSAQWLKVVLADLEARPADEQGTRLLAVAASVGRVRAHQLEIRDGAGVLRHVSPPPTYKVGRAAPEWFAALVALDLPVRHFALGDFRLSLHPDASRAVLDAWDELLALAGWGLLLLLAAEVLEFQQKRSQQHLAQCIGFRGCFLLQGQQLLQQALDVVLLLDCDI